MPDAWDKTLVTQLEALGESEVRIRFDRGDYGLTGGSKSEVVRGWLESKESARKSAREIRIIEIAEEANSIARSARRRATWANIIAAIAIAFSTIVAIFK